MRILLTDITQLIKQRIKGVQILVQSLSAF